MRGTLLRPYKFHNGCFELLILEAHDHSIQFIQPPRKLLGVTMNAIFIGVAVVIGLIVLYLVGSVLLATMAEKKRPNFFGEMQSVLRTMLVPLGFEEKEGPSGRSRSVEYSRDKFSVWLTLDIMDSLYYLTATSGSGSGKSDSDLSLEGHIPEADKFKSDSITRLNEWMVRQGIR